MGDQRRGADWGVKAREAALAIEPSPALQASLVLQEQPDEVRLLADCRKVFRETGADQLSARDIINAICNLPETEWAKRKYQKPISEKCFADLLRRFGLRSKKGGPRNDRKLWYRQDFVMSWQAYVPEDAKDAEDAEDAEDQKPPAGAPRLNK